jgi:hypothetical protein
VDGSPTPIVRTNALVRGVAVDAGSHVVEMAYRPLSFRWGAAISLASMLTLVTVVFERRRRMRRRTADPSSS